LSAFEQKVDGGTDRTAVGTGVAAPRLAEPAALRVRREAEPFDDRFGFVHIVGPNLIIAPAQQCSLPDAVAPPALYWDWIRSKTCEKS